MGKKSLTRDEVFLCRLAKLSQAGGDLFAPFDSYAIGKSMGQNNKSVDNIVRMLAQTNFVIKEEGSKIRLTSQGKALVEQLESK